MDDNQSENEDKDDLLLDSELHWEEDDDGEIDEEVKEIMENHDLDQEKAENVKEIMDEYGVDEDDAIELEELL